MELLVILTDNAVKFSPQDKSVIITAKKTDGQAELSVKDSGSGIAKKDLPFIFGRFYRADNSRATGPVDGYGLGLSIAQKIVGLHHGRISVESNPGRGSTFTVSLPVRQSKA